MYKNHIWITLIKSILTWVHSSKHSSWWRLSSFVFKTSWSRLIYLPSSYVFSTCWSRPIYSSWLYVSMISSNVFKTSSRHLQGIFKTSCQDIFKTSCKNVFKISSSCKDIFKTFLRHIIRLNCLSRSRICLGQKSEKFMVNVENLQVW